MNVLILLIIILNTSYFALAETKVCDRLIIHGDDKNIELSETEKKLVCGDPKNAAYKNIPSYQASYFLTGFFQSRGYLRPSFETKDNVLHAHTGDLVELTKVEIVGGRKKDRKVVKREVERRYLDQVITPDLINAFDDRVEQVLSARGYACPDTKSIVDAQEAAILTELNEGNKYKFGMVEREKIKGLHSHALDRYYPYHADETYNKKMLELNEKRLIRSGVVQGTYYLDNCSPDMKELKLSQYYILGPPKMLRFGVGVSTEQGPMVRFRWSNNRYKSMASILSFNAQASFKTQSINASADSFLWNDHPRRSILSTGSLTRESQVDYEQSSFAVTSQMKWTKDRHAHYQSYLFGPSYEGGTYSTQTISDTKSYSSVAFKGGFEWMSHRYEYFNFHPEAGDIFGMNFDFRHPGLGFSDPILKLDSTYAQFYEFGYWGRGVVIGGARFNAGTSWVSEDVPLQSLPPSLKFYGGGSNDLRGFQLNSLPDNKGLGALTKLGLKLELRRTYVVVESVEAFAFMDYAYFGEKSWSIDETLWYSPGAGVRWVTRLGLIQAFVARGYSNNPYKDAGNFYYIGIGGNF